MHRKIALFIRIRSSKPAPVHTVAQTQQQPPIINPPAAHCPSASHPRGQGKINKKPDTSPLKKKRKGEQSSRKPMATLITKPKKTFHLRQELQPVCTRREFSRYSSLLPSLPPVFNNRLLFRTFTALCAVLSS